MSEVSRDFPLHPDEVTNEFLSKCFHGKILSFELDMSMTVGGVLADAFRVLMLLMMKLMIFLKAVF